MKKYNILSVIIPILLVCGCNSGIDIVRTSYGHRPHNALSSQWSATVFEYTPAPGQFINGATLVFTGEETTLEAAAEYARRRLADGYDVSLGGFGGYIVVGFDHTIQTWGSDSGGYDFSITGNQFKGSSEPGIVWVKQDLNGNGKPDDHEPWYELKGSEYGNDTRGYSVTYFRPGGPQQSVRWVDSKGETGFIEYISAHSQDSYYPLWLNDREEYTLTGTCLPRRDGQLESGEYSTGDYDWGYADNWGQDMLSGRKTFFKISNAIDSSGNPVNLQYIDFVMVQTGVNIQGGGESGGPTVGELSTEVCRFTDEIINKD